jgi:hypothetical protein
LYGIYWINRSGGTRWQHRRERCGDDRERYYQNVTAF